VGIPLDFISKLPLVYGIVTLKTVASAIDLNVNTLQGPKVMRSRSNMTVIPINGIKGLKWH